MKIIKRKIDNVVLFCDKDFELTIEGLIYDGRKYPTITPITSEIISVLSVPYDFASNHYIYDNEGVWSRTPIGQAVYNDRIAKQDAEEKEASNTTNISNDVIITAIKNKTLPEIETWVSNQFSNLTNMTDTQIDNYINNNITDLSSAKNALKVIAKDLSQVMVLLRTVIKLSVWLAKKEINN